ncbi:uncharacterized protein [Amphiura filiformis]|uniref:uncharacterized protein n=1 Tax=Amphiura filiformis TaxID=82378 RepID=UPI003B216CB4
MIITANTMPPRTQVFTNEQTEILQAAWNDGLRSYSRKAQLRQLEKLAEDFGVTLDQVKNKIDRLNRLHKEKRRRETQPQDDTSVFNGKSAYTQFMGETIKKKAKENMSQSDTMRTANKEWRKIKGTPSVAKYEERAQAVKNKKKDEDCSEEKKKKDLLIKLFEIVSNLPYFFLFPQGTKC